jgi:hypothetical protein
MKQRARARHLRFVEPSPPTRAVPHNSSPTVLLFSKKLSNIASTQINGVLLSSCDRHRQTKLIVFESCFRFLKIQSSPATRLFERRAMKQRARARHQRVCRAVPVDKSCPPQRVVARSAVLGEAVQHRFHPVIASIQATQQRRAMKQRASKKLPDTASAQRVPASSTEFLVSICNRHRQPDLLVFENCFRFLKAPAIASSPTVRQREL